VSFKDRLKIFAVGFGIGLILLYFILSRRQLERPEIIFPETTEEIQREAVPGILQAYEERRVIMDSTFKLLVEEQRYPQSDGTLLRILLLQGKDPGQALRVMEYSHEEAGVALVDRVSVTSADQVVVALVPGVNTRELAERVKPEGYRLDRRIEPDGGIVVDLGSTTLAEYESAQRYLQEQTDVVQGVSPLEYDEIELKTTP